MIFFFKVENVSIDSFRAAFHYLCLENLCWKMSIARNSFRFTKFHRIPATFCLTPAVMMGGKYGRMSRISLAGELLMIFRYFCADSHYARSWEASFGPTSVHWTPCQDEDLPADFSFSSSQMQCKEREVNRLQRGVGAGKRVDSAQLSWNRNAMAINWPLAINWFCLQFYPLFSLTCCFFVFLYKFIYFWCVLWPKHIEPWHEKMCAPWWLWTWICLRPAVEGKREALSCHVSFVKL